LVTITETTFDDTAALFDSLEDFGLSSYEAKVYYTMLRLGLSTAREISNRSSIPFGRIYDVLSSLEDKYLIEKQDSRPKKYLVRDPKSAVKTLLDRKKNELDTLTSRAGNLETHLASFYIGEPEEGLFWSIGIGEEAILKHLGKIFETEKELILYVNTQVNVVHAGTQEMEETLLPIIQLFERGVKMRILIGGVTSKRQLKPVLDKMKGFEELPPIPTRYTSIATNSFDVIDGEKVLLKVTNPVDPAEYFAAIYVWQKRFATELRKKFDQMWDEAKEFPS
jgi:sugar-specific transcriptional regulator TrmB